MTFGKSFMYSLFAFLAVVYLGAGFMRDEKDPSGVRHCFSSLNGSHRQLVDAVEAQLRDPSSFEHVGTVLAGQDGSDKRAVVMTYRARNGFGGVNTETASAWIYPPDCDLVVRPLS